MSDIYFSDENGNEVYGEPNRVIGTYRFLFSGMNSTIIIGERVTFKNLVINVKGNNNLVAIGNNSVICGRILTAHTDSKVIIGENLKCNGPCRLHAAEGRAIVIGDNCLFSNVRFRTSDSHSIISLDNEKRINPAADIIVGDEVWMAEDVYLYKGVSVGSGSSIVGARSTVTKDLPENSLCVGSPAVVVKQGVSWNEKLI